MRIRRTVVQSFSAPLHKPYELSIGILHSFDTIAVAVECLDGRIGIGEAVALPGYGWETTTSIRDAVRNLIEGMEGEDTRRLAERCSSVWKSSPFAASAVMTALEMPEWLRHADSGLGFALNFAVAPHQEMSVLRKAASRALTAGYKHLKLKVGRDVDSDISATRLLLEGEFPDNFNVVMDANQAYSEPAAERFIDSVSAIDSTRVLWLEQPLDRMDWSGTERLCRKSLLPIVLDECIYDEDDVRRAAACGARGVKLKLCKNLGPAETLRLATVARQLNLHVVFGNGVATDLGNLAEYLVMSSAPQLFDEPSESSGFAKLELPMAQFGLEISGGRLRCSATAAALAHVIGGFCKVDAIA